MLIFIIIRSFDALQYILFQGDFPSSGVDIDNLHQRKDIFYWYTGRH